MDLSFKGKISWKGGWKSRRDMVYNPEKEHYNEERDLDQYVAPLIIE